MIFILDNYDSFTYNLYQYFGELGEDVIVRRPDACSLDQIEALQPELIVISPGPCSPNEAALSLEVIAYFQGKLPILGICLGHQAIGQVFGAEVVRAKTPLHGKISAIDHDGQGVFQGLPNPLKVTRYHSLALRKSSIPSDMMITAETSDGQVMGIRHKQLPIEGVQFHPEAILTEGGLQLLKNAVDAARQWLSVNRPEYAGRHKENHSSSQMQSVNFSGNDTVARFGESTEDIPRTVQASAEDIWKVRSFECIDSVFGKTGLAPINLLQAFRTDRDTFFLDSGEGYMELGKYSFFGAAPFLKISAYGDFYQRTIDGNMEATVTYPAGKDCFSILDDYILKYKLAAPAPFPFAGGAVGYFSYDLKDEIENLPKIEREDPGIPLWRLAWYDGIVVFDHAAGRYYLTACGIDADGECDPTLAQKRLDQLEEKLRAYVDGIAREEIPQTRVSKEKGLFEKTVHEVTSAETASNDLIPTISFSGVKKAVTREQYYEDLQGVIDYIYAGDIYQANLTQQFNVPYAGDPWELYTLLHHHNSAPFAAFLPYKDFQILSCSPERFIQVTPDGRIETRPIKGTRPRGKTPEEDERLAAKLFNSDKDRAELTMIIDLERNDLGRICEFGSVITTELFALEKYPTVWHLVATVEGKLKKRLTPGELLKAIFPGGSITGAPKIRAMEIIAELEPYHRGVYTGSIGYIGFDGAWDLNIVIRTVLLKDQTAAIHAGGGIVADSKPVKEYEETIHKAGRLLEVLGVKLDEEEVR
ncbi:aminodeoxychorismate synthase component I [Dehalobacter sp. DCM]|uniref:aminodeoxychorismate synthase component I n=1 Tax=Dehalobacter sp. DCM TaxID=2907827 RepID=UPI0030814EB7|nr:aminodeoxychorismate synthase component I [Dehalobacter sp. DCM]